MKRLLAAALFYLAASPCLGAEPARAGWDDFHVIMWQGQSASRYRALHGLGVDAGKLFGFRGPIDPAELKARLAPLEQSATPFYVENIATDFYAAYHRWTPEHPRQVTWLFDEAKRRYRANPADPAAFMRTPSLSDPAWLERIAQRLRAHGAAFAPLRPLYYSLGDETGIADLAAAWDFDRSPESLAAMRVWLRAQYGSLAALNRQWGSAFAGWDAVVPQTTTQALARTDGNYAAWTDFRSFMDGAFAHALRVGTDAVHAGDPAGLAGIEGTQAPGPGGYDYIRLAGAVDVMEMYAGGDSIDIARSFNPGLVVLTTSFGAGPEELRRIWHSLLLGARGLLIWDDSGDFVSDSGTPNTRAREMAPLLRELRDGLGAQLIASPPAPGPVAILYSPPSQHVLWLLARRGEATPWTERTSAIEGADDNPMRVAIGAAVRGLTHLGLTPRFVSPAMLADGVLQGAQAPRALVLPQAVALSPAEAAAIRRFVAAGGVVVADGTPGQYDGHGTRQATPLLADLATRLVPLDQLAPALAAAGVSAGFVLRHPDGRPVTDVAVRVLRNGGVTLLGLERDATGPAEPVELVLPAPAAIHDLRTGEGAAQASRFAVTLDPVAPTLLAIAPQPLPLPVLRGPARVAAGHAASWTVSLSGPSPAAVQALRVRVVGPDGAVVAAYSGTGLLRDGTATWTVPFAATDAPGDWRVEVTDMLGGGVARASLRLDHP
ncbi:MAG: hypothetical protein BGP12_20415 [Rhodospirillales bacterium 70-18]|nr:beta-galactosidase [Rhodospirillales bacterium]OJY67847.1 MAG: hypothetical protein BGP12_20415 [Rhodospirillales bacterium 70-18]